MAKSSGGSVIGRTWFSSLTGRDFTPVRIVGSGKNRVAVDSSGNRILARGLNGRDWRLSRDFTYGRG